MPSEQALVVQSRQVERGCLSFRKTELLRLGDVNKPGNVDSVKVEEVLLNRGNGQDAAEDGVEGAKASEEPVGFEEVRVPRSWHCRRRPSIQPAEDVREEEREQDTSDPTSLL